MHALWHLVGGCEVLSRVWPATRGGCCRRASRATGRHHPLCRPRRVHQPLGTLDVEDVDAFLAPYVAVIHRCVARTGGVVSTVAGDGIMAVFGAPVAHEDDPERGVRAALGIRETFASEAIVFEDDGLHFRIGVTTGEVLVTVMPDGAVRATGDIVNTAARLQASAPTDSVLVDETTHRATTRAIVLESVEPVEAKGKSEPVAAWLADGAPLGGARTDPARRACAGGTRRRGRDASGSARSRPSRALDPAGLDHR